MSYIRFTSIYRDSIYRINEEDFTEENLFDLRVQLGKDRELLFERSTSRRDRRHSITYISYTPRIRSTICWDGCKYHLLKHGPGGFQAGTNTPIVPSSWLRSLLPVKEAPKTDAVPVTAPPPAVREDTPSVAVEELPAPSPAVREREDTPPVVVEEVTVPADSWTLEEFDGDAAKQQFNEMVAWLRDETNIPYRSASVIQLTGWLSEMFASTAAAAWLRKNPVWRLSARAIVQEYGWLCERAEAKGAVAKFLKEW